MSQGDKMVTFKTLPVNLECINIGIADTYPFKFVSPISILISERVHSLVCQDFTCSLVFFAATP